jgi:hypothetical protein
MEASQYILRISAGPDYTNLKTINVNDDENPFYIHSEYFTGYICVRLLHFNGLTPDYYDSLTGSGGGDKDTTKDTKPQTNNPIQNPKFDYFSGRNRKYSMVIQGSFHHDYNGNDLLFGADFDQPINPPPGTSIAIRICKWLDPSMVCQVDKECSYMYSPIVSSMNALSITEPRVGKSKIQGSIITSSEKERDIGEWEYADKYVPEQTDLLTSSLSYDKRKKYFSSLDNRQAVTISKEYVYGMDFYDAYFDLNKVMLIKRWKSSYQGLG